jgi:NADPH:quinone reductase-like Zn-dependent oxidoreductase
MPSNRAAIQPAKRASALQVKDAPYPTTSDDKLVICNAMVAVSPIDWQLQAQGDMIFPYIKYPFVLGIDVTGEVVSVGKNVTRFRVGDRVFGAARGIEKEINVSAEGGFQNYVVVDPEFIAPVPSHIKYEEAVVTPLALATAGSALFSKDFLGLQLPTEPTRTPTGKTVIIWGGASSVGCSAIQLAVSAGYEVFTTASPKNFDLVRSLGAAQVFDYRSPAVAKDMISALAGKTVVGAAVMGDNAPQMCMEILSHCSADSNKFVILISIPTSPPGTSTLMTMVSFTLFLARYKTSGMFKGVKSSLMMAQSHEVIRYIFTDYLPKAMESGSFRPMPEPQIVGHGLEKIQEALDLNKKGGLSAKKLVVTL